MKRLERLERERVRIRAQTMAVQKENKELREKNAQVGGGTCQPPASNRFRALLEDLGKQHSRDRLRLRKMEERFQKYKDVSGTDLKRCHEKLRQVTEKMKQHSLAVSLCVTKTSWQRWLETSAVSMASQLQLLEVQVRQITLAGWGAGEQPDEPDAGLHRNLPPPPRPAQELPCGRPWRS